LSLSKKIKILIVDDSVLFRIQLQKALGMSEHFEVVGSAKNGVVALEKIVELDPDICIIDIEMPVMDGITTLKHICEKKYKTKVIMFSSHSMDGAEKTLDAMALGAIDFVAKPSLNSISNDPSEVLKEVILPKLESLFKINSKALPQTVEIKSKVTTKTNDWKHINPEILVIASSTGGPNALLELFSELTMDVPYPIVIAQHMPPLFTASLAERLGRVSNKTSMEAAHGEKLQPNKIYVVPGDYHLTLSGTKSDCAIHLNQGPHRNFVRPCADYLFETAAEIFKKDVLSIVLTGMGRDGCDGAHAVKENNGTVLIQDEASCAVFGMPGAVYKTGEYDFIDNPKAIARKVIDLLHRKGVNDVA